MALLPLRVPQGGTRHYLCRGPAYLCDDVPGRGTDVFQPLLMVLRGGVILIYFLAILIFMYRLARRARERSPQA